MFSEENFVSFFFSFFKLMSEDCKKRRCQERHEKQNKKNKKQKQKKKLIKIQTNYNHNYNWRS